MNISVKFLWFSVSFKTVVSLLIFWIDDLSVAVKVGC